MAKKPKKSSLAKLEAIDPERAADEAEYRLETIGDAISDSAQRGEDPTRADEDLLAVLLETAVEHGVSKEAALAFFESVKRMDAIRRAENFIGDQESVDVREPLLQMAWDVDRAYGSTGSHGMDPEDRQMLQDLKRLGDPTLEAVKAEIPRPIDRLRTFGTLNEHETDLLRFLQSFGGDIFEMATKEIPGTFGQKLIRLDGFRRLVEHAYELSQPDDEPEESADVAPSKGRAATKPKAKPRKAGTSKIKELEKAYPLQGRTREQDAEIQAAYAAEYD
jgi:hypothetical protein